MFLQIFSFELKLWFKKPATYIFFFVFFFLSVLLTAAIAGILGGAVSDSNATINSASAIAGVLNGLNTDIIGAIILITIMAPAVYKDFQYNMHPLLFTKPITKFGYMFGRFSAAFLVALFVLTGTVLGHMVTCAMPDIDSEKLGAFSLMNYVQPFIYFVVPNTLLVGAIFFSFVTFSRNMIAGYVGCVALILFKSITNSLLSDIDNKSIAAVLEPFGEIAFDNITEYWSPAEQNTLAIPFTGVLLYNRLLWFAIGLLITFFTYYRFQFSQFNNPVSFFKRKNKNEMLSIASVPVHSLGDIPKPAQIFTSSYSWVQTWFLIKFEFNKIVKSVFFLIILILSILTLALVTTQLGQIYGTSTYPVTYQILQVGGATFQFFMLILIVFYSGIVVWRERDSKVDELVGTAPLAPWVQLLSKFIALILIQAVLLFVVLLTGVAIQLYNGYYTIEIIQYIKELYGFKLIGLSLICALAIAVQVIINNKYVGYFVATLILIILPIVFNLLEWSNQLIQFNSSGPRLPYSDMNGYGHILFSFLIYKTYWIGFAGLLLVLSNLLWVRGKEKGFKARLKIAKTLFNGKAKLALSLFVFIFILAGGFIFYNTNILNKNVSSKKMEEMQAEFEKKYKRYSKTQQPRIVSANWNVDIFPKERGAVLNGFYILKNKSTKDVDSVILNMLPDVTIVGFNFEKKASLVLEDKVNGFYIYKLDQALKSGDSLKLDIALEYYPKGFKNSDAGTAIVYNGTFFNSSFLPSLGYSEQAELSEDAARKKYGLGKKERMANVNDSIARMNTYISSDADWIDFECVVSTSNDQIAIAPGYLQKQWEENGRTYFHYKMDCKILNFYSFLSASYEVKRDKWIPSSASQGKDVAIEIYYQKGHEYNIDRMIKGIKKSLDYYTKNFSPYQHRQVRILEFPRYATFAQSFPNTIPFSEGIGFIAKVDDNDPESIDYPFYVTAHEVAHQWWAHQVIGGNVQGSTLMAETMSQYAALMLMEKEFGAQAMKKFLKYEMNQYLQGRATEGKKERPLMLVENQQYIHYNKGSVIMYALKDYIGEDSLNAALAKYVKAVAYQEPPYTNSIEFVNYLKAATPDSLKYIINDMFETITLYENKASKCSYTKTADGKYLVKLTIESKKMKADSVGKLKDVAINDWIDIGIFGTKEVDGKKVETELYLQKRKIDKNKMEFEIIVDEEPVKAGVDPYNKLIDRTPDNNTKLFKGGDVNTPDSIGEEGGVTIKVGV
ncbi:MAG: ABC transporter permease [Bacteroidia bacterium]|nr:ABC transporter permease [Bacteroidia bacterium]